MNTQTLTITPEILSIIAEIDEFKGAWRALGKLAPEQLSSLKKIATIESVGSSTRIEGSRLSNKEVELLLSNIAVQKFTTRDEQEVAGYANVMNIIFQNYQQIPLSENYLQQLHSLLLEHSEKDHWHRGSYKKSPNHVEAFDHTGASLGIVFETTSPFETPIKMRELMDWANDAFSNNKLHPLLVTSMVIVAFLAIHPFQDGNGRLSRVLTTYLLLRQGYLYTPYSSLEAIVEQNKSGYYIALRKTQISFKTEHPDWQPWVLFFLQALQQQKKRLASKLDDENQILMQTPQLSLDILQLVNSRGSIKISDIVTITGANRNTIKKHLESLVSANRLQKNGVGKGTWYTG
jgi:Fic family protein